MLDRLRRGLARTTELLSGRFDVLVRSVEDGKTIEGLEELLISADIGVAATDRIVSSIKKTKGNDLRGCVEAEIHEIFKSVLPKKVENSTPKIVLVVGVNGTGKTTTVAKLAKVAKDASSTPLVCAADTFRAAAVEQLEVWTKRAGVDLIRASQNADPASVVYDAIVAGKARACDPIIVDTAGRLHTRANLMNELDKICRVAAREVEGAPHEVLLVLDATVGQNGLAQARKFMQLVGVTGVVISKLDGTAKGGVAVAVAQDLGLPIHYVGVGEGLEDLVPFSPDTYIEALFEGCW